MRKFVRSGALAFAAAVAFAAASAPSASAWSQQYCLFASAAPYPYAICESSGLHSLYYNEAVTTSWTQNVCEYMWNGQLGRIRGDWVGCNGGQTMRTWNRTGDAWYNAKAFNNTSGTILLSGYTTT